MGKLTPAKLSKRIETDLISLLKLAEKHGVNVDSVSVQYHSLWGFMVDVGDQLGDAYHDTVYDALYDVMRQANPEIPPF